MTMILWQSDQEVDRYTASIGTTKLQVFEDNSNNNWLWEVLREGILVFRGIAISFAQAKQFAEAHAPQS